MGLEASTVSEGIYRLSANVHDILFEGMWPIPNGVSINSYIVKGRDVAIIDGVCGWDGVPETLFAQLDELKIKIQEIKYIIINHMEPDHSGWIESFRAIRGDDFTIITSQKAVPLLEAFYGITQIPIRIVGDGDTLDLGEGRVLAFAEIPNVHWPETIATFDTLSGTLFPCDAFGSFGAIKDAPYDDQLSYADLEFFEKEAVRYYANIVAAFSLPTGKAIEKVEKILGPKLKTIAPGHGIVWRKNPSKIIQDYKRYVAYQKGPALAEVTVIWGSMYGNTEKALSSIREGLREACVKIHEFRVPEAHIGDILAAAWTSSGIILAMPTYEYKMFPPMANVLDELGKKKVQNRFAFRLGSFGWSGGAESELAEIHRRHKLKWKFLKSVEFKGSPKPEDLKLIQERSKLLGEKVNSWVLKGKADLDGCLDIDE